MIIDLKNLPSDIDFLHQMITDLVYHNTSLEEQLKLLKAKRFGKSSEKIDKQIADVELQIEENESAEAIAAFVQNQVSGAGSHEDEDNDIKKQAKRKKLPDHLPRVEVTLNPDPECPSCGSEEFRKISDDISERLQYVPSSFKVMRYVRPRCACKNCDEIVQAYAPSKTIDKGIAEAGLLAHILVQKYCNHLPLYRQSEIYARENVELSTSTMSGWVGQCSRLLEPLIDKLKKSIFTSEQIHGDDTPIKVLSPGKGKTKTGRIWCYVRDGRAFGDKAPPAVCYYYSPDRKGERPAAHLQNFQGVFHADAYSGYDKLYISEQNQEANIEEAACWAHTRRKFYEITVVNDKASIAISVLDEISNIYKIEGKIKGLDPGKRRSYRQKHSKPLVKQLFVSFKKALSKLPAKSATAKAIRYALNNETALMRFLDNGTIEIDNNAAERAMRNIALGRKNWLFAGSDDGGKSAAAIYSLIETAKMNNINPWAYLEKVLDTIQDHNHTKLDELLPWNITL